MLLPRALSWLTAVGALLSAAGPAPASAASLVYSVRTWEGEFSTQNAPGRGTAASPGLAISPFRSRIYFVRDDGTQRRELPFAGPRADAPMSDPDGHWIYFQSEVNGSGCIYRCHPDGSALTLLAPVPALGPDWQSVYGLFLSADGSCFTYTATDGKIGRSVLARADGSQPKVLIPEEGYIYMASPGMDGREVVASGPAHEYRLVLIDPRTNTGRVLTPDQPDSYVPQVTPDRSAIVYIRKDRGLYRIAPDGTELRRLATDLVVRFRLSAQDEHGSTDLPAISPDGRRVAFIAQAPGEAAPGVRVVDLDGTHQRPITHLAGACGRVKWSRDGTKLAFVSFVGDKPQLFVVPADGQDRPRQLTAGDGAVYTFSWLP